MARDAIIFVVDDDESVREALEGTLRATGWKVEVFASARAFLARERSRTPACLVLDVELPDLSGLELQARLNARGETMPIVFITGYGDIPMTVRAMRAGAVEFLTKPFTDEALLAGIERALAVGAKARKQEGDERALRERFDALKPRERAVMTLVTSGLLNKEVAAELGLSEVTVKVHRRRAMQKMGAQTLAELVRMAQRLGLPHA